MNDPEPKRLREGEDWQGFRELDRAIVENRLTEYAWKKASADPWERRGLWTFAAVVIAFVVFVVVQYGVR